jgi:hypothetical protein
MSERNGLTIWTVGDGHFVWDGKAYLNDGRPYRSLEAARRAADRTTPAHRHEVTHRDRGWACGSLTLELRVEGDIGTLRVRWRAMAEGDRKLRSENAFAR